MTNVLETIYLCTAAFLALYGFNALWLTWLALRHWDEEPDTPTTDGAWPMVTVQLPLFNERLVVRRLLQAVARMEYPRERLQVLVLDDSTDETTEIVAQMVDEYRAGGLNIRLVHRADRSGFKAGALAEAMPHTTGEIIVLFDADFVPPRSFLTRIVPYFAANPRLGCLQTRWGHINREYSLLTSAQALALDGHFTVEQVGRNRAGLFMSFNGTAGAWRRTCIEDSGGWSASTLCEDLDLSYRAQMRGWQFLYLPDVSAPAELPAQMAAFKRQQFRWAKGSIQCLGKLAGPLQRARLPWRTRLAGLVHLSGYLVHPLMLLLLLVSLPMIFLRGQIPWRFAYLSLVSLGPPLLYAVGQRFLCSEPRLWWRRYRALPLLMAVGVGIAWNNTVAVVEALLRRPGAFLRTPKFSLAGRHGQWAGSGYALRSNWTMLVELGLGGYALAVAWAAAHTGNWLAVPFFILYAAGFFFVALHDPLQGVWRRRAGVQPTAPGRAHSRLTSPVGPSRR
ncbi:MAG: glycosyltransferase [Chloroflexi bacterium]|nr:glycosyltransferase [Chloroflexota bacterium]